MYHSIASATARQWLHFTSLAAATHVVEEADEELGEVDAAIGNKVKAVVRIREQREEREQSK